MLLYIIIASILESLVSLSGILVLAIIGRGKLNYLLSFAVGTFLGVVFFELLPESIEVIGVNGTLSYTLAGFLFFYFISHFIFWYHHHEDDCHQHENVKAGGYLILIGDLFHNFIDGSIIALAFMSDTSIGIVTTIAVLAHEFPQEASDYFVLINSGFSKIKALAINLIVSSTTLLGALLIYFGFGGIEKITGPALGLVAGNFLYIAASDLIPQLNQKKEGMFIRFLLLFTGVAVIYFLKVTISE